MILIPNIDGCTIITDNGFCSILGHPFDIVPSLFVKRDKIDDTTTLISKTVKEVSVLEGNFHSEYYIELLKNLGIDVKVIPQKHPSKNFQRGEIMDRLVAIGDIHGCLHTLKDLLRMVSYSSQTDTLVFVGDYIDRGRFSCEVVNMLMKLQQQLGKDKVVCLRGNHEQMAIDAYRHGEYPLWYRNGGRFTEFSFEQNGEDIGNAISWFETLPLVYDTPEIIFCHAGLTYPLLKDNSPDDLLWGRDWIATDTEEREKQVVFGHTPSKTGRAYTVDTGDICIDAACVYGGRLCALVIQDDGNSLCMYVNKNEEDDF